VCVVILKDITIEMLRKWPTYLDVVITVVNMWFPVVLYFTCFGVFYYYIDI